MRYRQGRRPRRSAAVTLEAILGIPVLLIILLAIFLFGMIMTVSQGVTHAAIVAARCAAKVESTVNATNAVENDAVAAANQVLGVYGITASGLTPTAQVIIEDSTGIETRGANLVSLPAVTPITNPQQVRVRVIVAFSGIPIPDLLGSFGLSISGKRFDARSDALRDP